MVDNKISVVADPQKDNYNRVVFSFLDLFGQLGGVFELMCIWMGLIVRFFSKNVFLFSIFKRLYHTERESDQNDNDKESSDVHLNDNINGAITAKSQNNLNSPTNSRYEEQKVIPDSNPGNMLVSHKLEIRNMNGGDNYEYLNWKQKTTDESWAFDGVEQTSAIGMNLQENNRNSVSMHNHKNKNPIQNLK